MLRRFESIFFGLGPLFESGPPAGGAPAGEPPSGTPPAGGTPPGGGGSPPAPPAATPEQTVPYARFKEVNDAYAAMKTAEEARVADEAKKKGDFEELSKQEKAKRELAETRAVRIARRGSFIAKAAGKVTDAEAAYKLAVADGLLDDIEVDDEGNAKDPTKVDAAVAEVTKRYEFLKAGSKDFGDPKGGNGPNGGAPDPKDARGMLRLGYDQGSRRGQ